MCGQHLPSKQKVKRQEDSCSSSTMQPQKTDVQPRKTLEPCKARIVPTSYSQVVPTNNKEFQRSSPPVIRGETSAFSGAKPVHFKRLSSSTTY